MMQQNCGENNHCMRRFITSMREICEICDIHDKLTHIKFWSFSTKERDCSRLQRMNEITIMKRTLDIKDRHFRVRWMEFVNSMALRITRPTKRPSDFLVCFSNYVIYIYFS